MDVLWIDKDGIERTCSIIKETHLLYTLLLPERNVPLEYVFKMNEDNVTKGSIVYYYKNHKYLKAIISKIDLASSSVQIRLIKKVPKKSVKLEL